MMTCPRCEEQLLEYVYGLLDVNDPADAAIVNDIRTHLATCASCQAALRKVEGQQKLLAEASRSPTSFVFTAPKMEVRKAFSRRTSTVTAWYVSAATLLVALLGVMGTAYWWGTATKWLPVEQARLELEQLRQGPAVESEQIESLQIKINELRTQATTLVQTVKQLEDKTQRELWDKTAFQQLIAPMNVQSNNDTPLVVTSNTLNGKPAPLPDVAINLTDLSTQQGASQQFRKAQAASNKFNLSLSSLAYAHSAGKVFNNEIVQDVSKNLGSLKLSHPLQVLQAEFAAHLCTDKPLYQPGDDVYFRGIALEKASFTNAREELTFLFKLIGPDDKTLYTAEKKAQLIDPKTQQPIRDVQGKTLQGVGDGVWKLPATMPLGESTLILSEKNERFPAQIVKFMVNAITAPRFDKQLQFTRPSYAPGDPVVLTGKVKLPSQQPWANGNIKCQIQIDGEKYDALGNKSDADISTTTDANGTVKFAFQLPAAISKGQGTLAMQFQSSEGNETWAQPIRIETGELLVECYPEGGELIAGVPNHVYFQVRNLNGEATEAEAELLDQQNKVVEKLATFHDETEAKASRGMGKFSFIPQANEVYSIRVKKPFTSQIFNLPAAKASGVGLHIEHAVLPAGSPLYMQLSNMGQGRELVVSVHCREVLIALDRISMPANLTQNISVENIQPLGGVYRVTVSEYTTRDNRPVFLPLAERLIYRHPSKVLNLNLKTNTATNGRTTQLQIEAKDEKQVPTGAYCTIVGVNKSLLQLAEVTTNRRLPAHFLIAQEVRQPEELEFADFFLTQHPSAPQALDLLLGVQGWRRFKASPLELAQANRQTQDNLSIQCFDNRKEVINQVIEQVKLTTEQSPEGILLKKTQSTLQKYESDFKAKSRQQSEQLVHQQEKVKETESLLSARQTDWQTFSLWFHLLSASALAIFSLIALAMLCLKRVLLPMHLICTIGCLAALGLLGAGYLWMKQATPAAIQPINQPTAALSEIKASSPPILKSDKPLAEKSSELSPLREKDPSLLAAKEEVGDKALRSMEKEIPIPTRQAKQKMPAVTTPAPGAAQPQTDSKALSPPANLGSRPNPAIASPPNDKLRLSGGAMSQQQVNRDYKQNQLMESNGAQRRVETQRSTRLADNRLVVPENQSGKKDTAAATPRPGASEGHERLPLETANKKGTDAQKPTMPGSAAGGKAGFDNKPAGVGGLGGGGIGESGLASGGRGNLNPSPADLDHLKTSEAFYIREYAWSPAAQPANLKPPLEWSQTVYWHPLKVVPASGSLTIPLELPPSDTVYHFEVFGYDGEGRLGATSIEIKAPALSQKTLPLSLHTKLSTPQAKVGDVVQLECTVQNLTTRRQPQVIAKIALPEGLKLPDNLRQLRNAVKSSTAGEYVEPTRWYIQGKELTLVWSELGTEQKARLSIDLVCNKPGQHQAAASRAYLENQERDATVADGMQMTIRP